MRLFYIAIIILLCTPAFSQQRAVEDNDPKATAILHELRQSLESANGLTIAFNLQMEYPNEPINTLSGSLTQKGQKYRLALDDQLFISDGADLWLYQKEPNEVQINDIDPDAEGFNSPRDFIAVYERDDFMYILNPDDSRQNGDFQIDFKPLASDATYFKIRLTIASNKRDLKQVKVFEKDGSRYTIIIRSVDRNPNIPEGHFTFDPSQYPNVHIEDLRLD